MQGYKMHFNHVRTRFTHDVTRASKGKCKVRYSVTFVFIGFNRKIRQNNGTQEEGVEMAKTRCNIIFEWPLSQSQTAFHIRSYLLAKHKKKLL